MKAEIFIAPIKKTDDYIHYVVYLSTKDSQYGMRILENSAFQLNKFDSGLPPVTLRVQRFNHEIALKSKLTEALSLDYKMGEFKVIQINGYYNRDMIIKL